MHITSPFTDVMEEAGGDSVGGGGAGELVGVGGEGGAAGLAADGPEAQVGGGGPVGINFAAVLHVQVGDEGGLVPAPDVGGPPNDDHVGVPHVVPDQLAAGVVVAAAEEVPQLQGEEVEEILQLLLHQDAMVVAVEEGEIPLVGADEDVEVIQVEQPADMAAGQGEVAAAADADVVVPPLNEEEVAELRDMLLPLKPKFHARNLQQLSVRNITNQPISMNANWCKELTWPALEQVVLARQGDARNKFLEYHLLLTPECSPTGHLVIPEAPSSVNDEEAHQTYDLLCLKIASLLGDSVKYLSLYNNELKHHQVVNDIFHVRAPAMLQNLLQQPQQQAVRGPSEESMHTMLEQLPKLEILGLNNWPVTDTTLQIIGNSCPELRELELESDLITRHGLLYLCERCPDLEVLSLGSSAGISADDLRRVLRFAPNLHFLLHPQTHRAVQLNVLAAELAGTPLPKYRLTHYCCRVSTEDLLPFRKIHRTLPYLINLRADEVHDLGHFNYPLRLRKEILNTLVLSFSDTASVLISAQLPALFTALRHESSSLAVLGLLAHHDCHPLVNVDLSEIAESFPNLFALGIIYGFTFWSVHEVKSWHFSKLQTLTLLTNQVQNLPDMCAQILANPHLELANILTMTISPQIFEQLAAPGSTSLFSRLEHLAFFASGWTPRQLTKLVVSRAPHLRSLGVGGLINGVWEQCRLLFREIAPWLRFGNQ